MLLINFSYSDTDFFSYKQKNNFTDREKFTYRLGKNKQTALFSPLTKRFEFIQKTT